MQALTRTYRPDVLPKIYDRFGPVANCLTLSSFFYGGAVRDSLAGVPLVGDLDVCVADTGAEVSALLRRIYEGTANEWHMTERAQANNPYNHNPAISRVIECTNNSGLGMHIVKGQANAFDKTPRSAPARALLIPKTVDIVCCGVAIDCWGFVYELIPGAIRDCHERLIRVIKVHATPATPARVEKLRLRGYKIPDDYVALIKGVSL